MPNVNIYVDQNVYWVLHDLYENTDAPKEFGSFEAWLNHIFTIGVKCSFPAIGLAKEINSYLEYDAEKQKFVYSKQYDWNGDRKGS